MLIKIKAYRDNDLEDGESIRVSFSERLCLYSAKDIDQIIVELMKASVYAKKASVEDEPLEIVIDL